MDTSLALVANLSEDDIKLAIKKHVESQTNMEATEVTLTASPTHDYYDRATGGFSMKASVSLKKRAPSPYGTDH